MASTIILSDNGASSGSAGVKTTGGDDGKLILQTTTSGGTATSALTIDTSQNVGIGSTPGGNYKLEVSGRISISGSSYITNPTTLVIGQYSATEGYIQVPSSGKLNIWDNGSANIASFLNNGNFQFNSGYGSVATAYGCRAWGNFDTSNGSSLNLRGSGGVSSISFIATGRYTINLSVAMPDTNYCVAGSAMLAGNSGAAAAGVFCEYASASNTFAVKTTSAVQVCTVDNNSDTLFNTYSANFSVFR